MTQEILHIVGYFAAILIGISLGIIGGGGTILAVPVMVYLFQISPVMATGYSLFVVGITSGVGTIHNIRQKMVDVRIAFLFGLPAIFMVFITRRYIIHAIPELLFEVGTYQFTRDIGLMVLFAVLMLLAAYFMLGNPKWKTNEVLEAYTFKRIWWLVVQGSGLGLLSGLLGAGGGFLIVPALIIFSGLDVKKAIATSLMIISINLTTGFLAVVAGPFEVRWPFLLTFTGLAVMGILAGTRFARFIPANKIRPAFGIFILCMGLYILIRELVFH
ncbi:MAG: sulfite exporter TauE/SafE family protein [Chitinophagales bacterium]|nr:sulfite exporter TauE/SafE family protein [Chitinophagales bacterium]